MNAHIHMQDQIENRIEDLMNEKRAINWDEFFQNVTTFSLIIVFMTLGVSW